MLANFWRSVKRDGRAISFVLPAMNESVHKTCSETVISADAGIQRISANAIRLDSGLRRNDENKG